MRAFRMDTFGGLSSIIARGCAKGWSARADAVPFAPRGAAEARAERIDALRKAVVDGAYHVDSGQLAKRMVDRAIRESARHRAALRRH